MVRQVMVLGLYPVDLRDHEMILNHHGNDSRGICFQNEWNEFEQRPSPANHICRVSDVFGWGDINVRLRAIEPRLSLGELSFSRPDGREVFVQLSSIIGACSSIERAGLLGDAIQNAASVSQTLTASANLLGAFLQK